MMNAQEIFSFLEHENESMKAKRTGTFTDNMKLPVHRWFRYSAGFSAEWVKRIVKEKMPEGGIFFDPFAGSGTSLIAAQEHGVDCFGTESHPFVARIANAKLAWDLDVEIFKKRATLILDNAMKMKITDNADFPDLLRRCYSEHSLKRLEALRLSYYESDKKDKVSNVIWLVITSILRECSCVGTAQWQYVLPNKNKSRISDPFEAFIRRVNLFVSDILTRKSNKNRSEAILLNEDCRNTEKLDIIRNKVDLIVTSPPYPNNYDYADATRLELTFWREIAGWKDLQCTVRHKLVRSCSQHSAAEKLKLEELLDSEVISPIKDELSNVCNELSAIRMQKGGKKTYHTMVGAYFNDLALIWRSLRQVCRSNSAVCFVIGDSAPYGVHVPVERWLAQLAVAEGFSSPNFDKIRDRNLKWKNRKHRVPLLEGNLWLKG